MEKRMPSSFDSAAILGRVAALSAALLCVTGAKCQITPAHRSAEPAFEVASIKLSGPGPRRAGGMIAGGPGTDDPNRIRAEQITVARLISTAYDLPFDQILGPGWLQEQNYQFTAKLPEGSSKADLKLMLRSLLAERFRLVFHLQSKEFPVYELTVAPRGLKLKPTAHPDARLARPGDYGMPAALDADGYPVIPPGVAGSQGVPLNGAMRTTYQSVAIAALIHQIESSLGTITGLNTWAPARVVDKTGLTGKYDFKLELGGAFGIGGALRPQTPDVSSSPDGTLDASDPNGGPDIFRALEKQLGLRLTRSKASFDVLVVDRAERVPTEN
jgi:uncharacterized protein (TIGR03435 family)